MACKLLLRSGPIFMIKFTNINMSGIRGESNVVVLQPSLESSFNAQINSELFAGYTYQAMANFFGRQCIALPGCYTFYMEQVKEEQGHAKKLMDFVSKRGGSVVLQPVLPPDTQEWDSPLASLRMALALEIKITEQLLNLHQECEECSDLFASNYLENEFLDEQIESVDQIARYVAQAERMGCEGLAVHFFDQYLLSLCNQNEEENGKT